MSAGKYDYVDKLDWSKAYEPPLHIQTLEKIDLEGDVMRAIFKHDIQVDKDELIKALEYDRNQFRAGYEAAIRDMHEAAKNVVCGNADARAVGEVNGDDDKAEPNGGSR